MARPPRHQASPLRQGFALGSWKPVAYPLDGDWRSYEFGDIPRLVEDLTRSDPATWATWLGLIRDPFDDLAVWHGVTTELAYTNHIAGSRWQSYDIRGYAQDCLQARRDSQAAGKQLWAVNLLREAEWSMFACRLIDTHLINPDTVDYVRHRLARI
jgi:hypothetical protein